MTDILVLSTSIFLAAGPVLAVPSGQTHTKNLSTQLTFFIMFPHVTKTFSGSFFEGWVMVGLEFVCQDASLPKQLALVC